MLRVGTLPLEIETGRYSRPVVPLDERLCLCDLKVLEDERHFLLQCPLYDDQRQHLYAQASVVNENFKTSRR